MTQTTEQARSAFLPCPFCGGRSEFNEHDELCYFTKLAELKAKPASADLTPMLELLEAWNRRAPAVPQEPTSKQVVLGAGALLGQPERTADNRHPEWHSAVEKVRKVYLAMLAAAPQPPEAAPVELPEPVAFALEWTFNGEERGMRLYDDETHCRFDAESDGGVCHPLYTEQQVRDLLAASKVERKPLTHEIITETALQAGAAKFYPEKQRVIEQNYVVSAGFLQRFAVALQEQST